MFYSQQDRNLDFPSILNNIIVDINRHPIGSSHSLYQTVIETFAGSSIMVSGELFL